MRRTLRAHTKKHVSRVHAPFLNVHLLISTGARYEYCDAIVPEGFNDRRFGLR